MLIPTCVLVALVIAAGIAAMTPRWAAALESAAVRFQDRDAYASLELNGAGTARPFATHVPLRPTAPASGYHQP